MGDSGTGQGGFSFLRAERELVRSGPCRLRAERGLVRSGGLKSGGGPPQSKTLARPLGTAGGREASWSAPVPWRFFQTMPRAEDMRSCARRLRAERELVRSCGCRLRAERGLVRSGREATGPALGRAGKESRVMAGEG